MSNGATLHPDRHRTAGRTDPAKLRGLYEDGHTIRLGNLQRVVPFLADVSRGIQQETGYSNYLHAFVTPPGRQGLLHHWDQQMAVIVQIAGSERWQLWRPMFSSPMREYQESFRVWDPGFIPRWKPWDPTWTSTSGRVSPCSCRGGGSTIPTHSTPTPAVST
ncbi:JmjC domain-containing protein [Streptomyces cyaneofuscatus]|uniref:JmjC domain-containing protein n=1 Tax=Streptomyces cyaneofuscatus TaxID=66883 RepID=UPI0036D7AF50